jgi:hypothetical protein
MVPIYGIPKLVMDPVRNSDMNRTPDIRTRCIVPEWACQIEITFVRPLMRVNEVVKLLAAAGLTQGIGDWRPEKGKGTYGQFQIVEATNADWKRIVAKAGRGAQPLPRFVRHGAGENWLRLFLARWQMIRAD